MSVESPKKIGRFIKKDSRLSKVVSVNEFSLLDICVVPITYPDNPQGNIIHKDLHVPAELEDGVRLSSEIDASLDQSGFRHILQPMDFTEEWNRQKKRASGSSSKFDEEDELELELEYLNQKKIIAQEGISDKKITKNNEKKEKPVHEDKNKIKEPLGPDQKKENEVPQQIIQESDPQRQEIAEENLHSKEASESALRIKKEPIESVGEAIKEVAEQQDPTGALSVATEGNQEGEFYPMKNEGESRDLEMDTMQNYKDSMQKLSPEKERELVDAASARGYQEGFRQGEEKASLQFQEQSREFIRRIQESAVNLASMKKDVLENSQENFLILSKALFEGLLKKEFEVNPDSFNAIVKRAIHEGVGDDEFKISVNLDTFNYIRDNLQELAAVPIDVDEEMETFDFKITSNLTMVDGKIKQIIEDLIASADLNLFESSEKAS